LIPLALLVLVNFGFLVGISRKNTIVVVFASLILPIEWITGLLVGGSLLSSGIFHGQNYITSFPHYSLLAGVLFIVFLLYTFTLSLKK
jgi:hypothetical protein